MPIQLILLIIMLVLMVLSFLLAPKPKFENARPAALGDFSVPTATEQRAVPIIWGTIDVLGPNVIWYGDLLTVAIRKKVKTGMFKKKKITVGFRYFIGMDLAIGYGPLDRITSLEVSDKRIAIPITTPTPAGATLDISEPNHFGGKQQGGGMVGRFTIYDGSLNQLQDPYLQSVLGTDIPAYMNISHAVWERGEVGESVQIQPWTFRVTRFPDNLGLAGSGHIVSGTIEDGDANPAEALYEIMTDELFGLNIDPLRIDLASFAAAGNTLATEENGWSIVVTSVTPAIDLIKEILRQVDGVLFEDSDGVFHLILARNDFSLPSLPVFDDSNIIEMKQFSRGSWSETFNHINIAYTDRTKDFIATGAGAQDTANVRIQDAERRADLNYPGVKHPDTANEIAARELRALSFPLAKVRIIVNRDGRTLVPGDVIKLTWPKFNIVDMVIRVLVVDLGSLLDGQVEINGVQDMFRLGDTFFKSPNATGWTPVDDSALAAIFELVRQAPVITLNTNPDEIDDPTGARVLSVVSSPSGASTFFEQFVDDGGGGGFEEAVGESEGFTPNALLAAAYPAATADIESSDLLLLDTARDFEVLSDEPPANIAQGLNLALIEGATEAEDEIIGWEELFDNGGGSFTLKRVHRGLMDTQARDHANNARIWFFSDFSALSDKTYGDTQAISVKHQTKTSSDILDIASASANPITFASRSLKPHHPANWEVNATRVPVAVDETAPLALTWEHRLNADAVVRDADDGSVGTQDTAVEYNLEFRHAVTQAILRSVTLDSASPPPVGGTWLSYTYLAADLQSDTGEVGDFPLEARIEAEDTGLTLVSLQEVVHDFNVDMGGALVRSIDLDGTTEFLEDSTTASTMGFANAWTMNVWVRFAALPAVSPMRIFNVQKAGAFNSIQLQAEVAGTFSAILEDSAAATFKVYTFGTTATATWFMVTLTWDGTTLTTYVDGSVATPTKVTDLAGTMTDTARFVRVGSLTGAAIELMDGLVFSPALWDTDLASAAVSTVYNAGSGSTFNLRANSGSYVSAGANLKHLWDWRDSASIGRDYGHISAGKFDLLNNSVGITAADLSVTVP